MIPATMTTYDAAVEFIRLGDILRLYQWMGWEPSGSMIEIMCEYRYVLDRVPVDWDSWTNDAWVGLVQKTPTHNDFPAIPGRVVGGN